MFVTYSWILILSVNVKILPLSKIKLLHQKKCLGWKRFAYKMVTSVRNFDVRRSSVSFLCVGILVMFALCLILDWIHRLGIDSFQTSLEMAPVNSTLRRSARMLNLSNLDGGGYSLPITPPPSTGPGPEAQSTPLASPDVIRAEIGRWKGRQEALVRDLLEASGEKVC